MKKWISGLRKIQLFPMAMTIFWNYCVVADLVFANKSANHYLSPIPNLVCLLIGLAWIAAGVFFVRKYLSDKTSLSGFFGTFIWNAVLPFATAFLYLQLQDKMFTYTGFMPGLEALWDAVYATAILIAAAAIGLSCTIFFAVRTRRRAVLLSEEDAEAGDAASNSSEADEEADGINAVEGGEAPAKDKLRFSDVLNLLTLVVVVPASAAWLLQFCGNLYDDFSEKVTEKHIAEYRVELFGENYASKEQEIVSDNFTMAFVVDYSAAQDEELIEEWKSENLKKMYELGVGRYKELLQKYTYARGVDGINNRLTVDTKNRTYSCCYPIELIDEEANAYVEYAMVLVFSEDNELIDIHFESEWEIGDR